MLKIIAKKASDTVRSTDIYGQEVTIRYKRNTTYQTHLGG
jgi:hypothetical protein